MSVFRGSVFSVQERLHFMTPSPLNTEYPKNLTHIATQSACKEVTSAFPGLPVGHVYAGFDKPLAAMYVPGRPGVSAAASGRGEGIGTRGGDSHEDCEL